MQNSVQSEITHRHTSHQNVRSIGVRDCTELRRHASLLVAHPALEHEKCNGGFKADWTTNGTFLISTFVRHPHLSKSWSRVQRYADTFYWSLKKRIPSHTDHLPWWLFVLWVWGHFQNLPLHCSQWVLVVEALDGNTQPGFRKWC